MRSVLPFHSLKGSFDLEDIYLIIIGFYFGTQAERRDKEAA